MQLGIDGSYHCALQTISLYTPQQPVDLCYKLVLATALNNKVLFGHYLCHTKNNNIQPSCILLEYVKVSYDG